jgi:hypothetical protein
MSSAATPTPTNVAAAEDILNVIPFSLTDVI